jgi:glycosyltransferase involved in cell wall biosynthesis
VLVTVIIPTKNRSTAVVAAVRSIFLGTYQDFEMFVVDQSPDTSTYTALMPFTSDARFHYLQNRRIGVGAASSRNMGIALSSGQIIAIMDDDVEARPDWLAQIVAEFAADPDLSFISGKLTAPPYDSTQGFIPSFDAPATMTARQLPIHAAGANFSMRRTLFDIVGGYDEYCGPGSRLRASDDTDLSWRIVRSGAKWKTCAHIEVIHTHGFRGIQDAQALHSRYQYGNGGNFGRFTRRGDLYAGTWFLLREVRRILRALPNLLRSRRPHGLEYSLTRLRGFWHGFTLSPREGFVSGEDLKRRGQELKLAFDRSNVHTPIQSVK